MFLLSTLTLKYYKHHPSSCVICVIFKLNHSAHQVKKSEATISSPC